MKKRKINERNMQVQLSRRNPFKAWLFEYMFAFSAFARIPIEVHTRKSFGERYFSFSSSIITLLFFCWCPVATHFFTVSLFRGADSSDFGLWAIIYKHGLLYAYLIYTGYACWLRDKEKKSEPSVYDFAKYSKSTGLIDKRILKIRYAGRLATLREIETFFEPLIFFVPGVLLILIGQSLGFLLVFCSVIYSLGYCAAYKMGDDHMMDIIDDSIIKEELIKVIVEGRTKAETRGYQFYGTPPNDRESRYKAAYAMAEDIDYEEVK